MKKLAAIILGTLMLISSSYADGIMGERENCGTGSTCGECVNADTASVTAANTGVDAEDATTDPRETGAR